MKYISMYRCGCCNGYMYYGFLQCFETVDDAKKGISRMVQKQTYDFIPEVANQSDATIPTELIHECPSGDVGIAKFSGFHLLSEEEEAMINEQTG